MTRLIIEFNSTGPMDFDLTVRKEQSAKPTFAELKARDALHELLEDISKEASDRYDKRGSN